MVKRQAATRIIGGKYKGTKLVFKPNKMLRPTESKTKETLFNWLLNDLDKKKMLRYVCRNRFTWTRGYFKRS
jgi:16S rRNA G966 N2-methylase RsmD